MLIRHVTIILSIISITIDATPLWVRPAPSETITYTKISKDQEVEDYFLPETLLPVEYNIELIPYLDLPATLPEAKKFTFDGTVYIRFRVLSNTNQIVLHAYDITIGDNAVEILAASDEGEDPDILVTNYKISNPDDTRQFLTIDLDKVMREDQSYRLFIKYRGKINDDLEGFYRSSYTDSEGETKWLGVTQFETTAARRAFPCFDEPKWRARFTLHIAHPPQYKVLANMPLESDNELVMGVPDARGWTWARFMTSPSMPTYLVAFSINQFESITNPKNETFKLWARPEAVHQGKFSNDVSPKIVDYMTFFTTFAYSLPKVDQIAIPDFSAGAMENWGLITYRETALLFEEGVSSSANRQRVETVVTHELAHQWFGNLVTPMWWDNIWLNEGFATYFEYHALAEFQPTWQLERQFVLDEMYEVLQTDSLESTHPLLVPDVKTPQQTLAVFDSIAYNKGGCMVRFLVKHMEESRFRLGIKNYISRFHHGNAEMKDLWYSLHEQVPINLLPRGITLERVMNTWTLQSGYPVVTVIRNYTTRGAAISQHRFMTMHNASKTEVWMIPLTFSTQNNPNFDSISVQNWLTGKSDIINSLNISSNQWVVFNNKQIGYYRVNYDEGNWRLLIFALNNPMNMRKIEVINRAQIMDDALALARSGLLDYELALDTTSYLSHESEYMPWTAALRALSYINDRLSYEKHSRDLFQSYMLSKLDAIYSLVNGFNLTEDDSHIMRLKRSTVLLAACSFGHQHCNDEALKRFQAWRHVIGPDNNNPVEPDVKSVVYCSGMKQGGRGDYDFLFARYEASANVASEQALILAALGCASDTKLLEEYLEESIKENSKIRPQDARGVITAVYHNPVGVDVALDFLLTNWNRTSHLYDSIGSTGRVITGLSRKLNTQTHRNKLSTFLATYYTTLTDLQIFAITDAINTVDITLKWHEDHSFTVLKYLGDNIPSPESTTPRPTTPRTTSPPTPKPTDDAATISIISPISLCLLALFSILY